MHSPIEQFREAIRAAGLNPPDVIVADGKLRRFAVNGKRGDDSGWYVAHDDGIPAGAFGDWRSGLSQTWRADVGRRLTPKEESAHREKLAAIRQARAAEGGKRHADAACKAAALWKAGTPAGADHPYLTRKGVAPVASLRELPADDVARIAGYSPKAKGEPLAGRVLLAPVVIGDKPSTVELIDESGRKSALAGGAKAGGYWAAQALPDGDGEGSCILIAEGVATALSAREATGHSAIAALSAGQLAAVARTMRERHPAARLVVLADVLDATGEPDPRAVEAACTTGAVLAIPDFEAERPEGATDFNDMATHRGKEAVKRAIDASIAAAMAGGGAFNDENPVIVDSAGWPEPQPLTARLDPEAYPFDALPDGIRAAVQEVAGFVQAPVALVASSALGALSLACQAQADVKRAERLQGPCGLFLLAIADSGERKTTCDGFFTSAIREYEAEQAELAKPELQRFAAAIAAWTAERDGILASIKGSGRNRKPTDQLRADLVDLERRKPEGPRVPRLIYGDATPEALTYGLAKSWPSGGVISSEAGAILGAHGMGRESIMRHLAILNELWDGRPQTFDRRKEGGSFTVRGARLTVVLQVQDATLREFFSRSGALARGSGFLARFLLAWPESTQGQRRFAEAPESWPALSAFHRRIGAILRQPVPIDDGALSPPVLPLTPDAKDAWVGFHNEIEAELRAGGELHEVRDVASKAADNAARLAALFHAFAGSGGAIAVDALGRATRIVAWHLSEARRFFGELALPAELYDAGRLDSWLIEHSRRQRVGHADRREAQRTGPVRDGERLTAALRVLAELDRAREGKDGKRKLIFVHPALVRCEQ